ncbi:MAG: DNA repair protein RadC [Desulfobacterales bacterium]
MDPTAAEDRQGAESRKPRPTRATDGRPGHRRRLRERFLTGGLEGFLDYEVVELLLTLATPRRDCKAAAKEALSRFKNLPGVLEADPAELLAVPGIGPKNALGIRLVKAVAERYLAQRALGRDPLSSPRELLDYLNAAIRDKSRECFVCVFLDARNRVLAIETLFEGTLTAASVYPREVIRAALGHRAAGLVFAHNHPSGEPRPSAEDLAVTRQLLFAARVMGIAVHDHLIIGGKGSFSFAEQGLIERLRQEFAAVAEPCGEDPMEAPFAGRPGSAARGESILGDARLAVQAGGENGRF